MNFMVEWHEIISLIYTIKIFILQIQDITTVSACHYERDGSLQLL